MSETLPIPETQKEALRTCRDGYVIYSDDPYAREHLMIDDFLMNISREQVNDLSTIIREHPSGIAILESDPQTQIRCLRTAMLRAVHFKSVSEKEPNAYVLEFAYAAIYNTLLRRSLPFSKEDLIAILDLRVEEGVVFSLLSDGMLFKSVEKFQKRQNDKDILQRIISYKELCSYLPNSLKSTINRLLGDSEIRLNRGDNWGNATADFLESLDPEQSKLWRSLILLASQQIGGSKPTKKFLQAAHERIQAIGKDLYTKQLTDLLTIASELRPVERDYEDPYGIDLVKTTLFANEMNETILRSLIWTVPAISTPTLCRYVGDLASHCFIKIAGQGPVALKLGNSCISTLGSIDGLEGVAALARLRFGVRHNAAQRTIEKLIDEAAQRQGMTPYEIEDLAVPTFDLQDGKGHLGFGDFTAELTISDTGKTELRWKEKEGKPQKSIPSDVKRDYPDELKLLKGKAKDIEKMLPAQRDRLDNFYIDNRTFSFDYWQQHFLHHGLMSIPTKKLIWMFEVEGEKISVIWEKDRLVDAMGNPAPPIPPDAQGRLWHPLNESVDDVIAWRNYIEGGQIRQPFKQAYREVYIVTDAELNTETYSNRFAAHIVRQHQLSALARGRGWTYTLLGAFDDGRDDETAQRTLRAWGITAEFRVDEIWNDEGMAQSGIWLYVTTDQVRFARNGHPMNLVDVPPIVFSEIMRDVDLFVGVAGIGNDPNWEDQGVQRYNAYWQSYSFGPLTASSAQIRKEALERILPRLGIAPRCSIRDPFLVVRGDLRTYKIHMGSGNILMEPNDQYLCIVPDNRERKGDGKIFLPFEEDGMLSLILSKAFLLAEDTKITDQVITRQINFMG